MASLKFVSVFLAAVMAVHGGTVGKAKPALSGTHSLGIVMPQLSGWGGWVPTTPTPEETTTGWSTPETTTTQPPPETTTTTTQGWTTPPPTVGWQAPPQTGWDSADSDLPVSIEILGESAIVGEGESGATHGSETSVSGDSSNPAVAVINSGSYSSLGQGSGVLQISNFNNLGESNTFQGIDGYNFGDSGENFGGSISGNQINTLNGGGSFVVGQGAIGQGGFTINNNIPFPSPPPGWRQ